MSDATNASEQDPAAHGDAGAPKTAGKQSRAKTLLGIGSGNAMEWFDWGIYTLMATYLADELFSKEDPTSAILKTLAVFAVGFFARPFGGLLFGWIADKKGRKLSMTLTVAVAAGGSLLIGLTPTYEQIGVGSSLLLLIARLGQGLAHGGELPSAQTYIAETAPDAKRGLWASLIYFSGTFGVVFGYIIGAVLTTVFSQDEMSSYGWRIPFILGGVFGLFALYMRSRLHETETFVDEVVGDAKAEQSGAEHPGMWTVIKEHPKLLAQVIGLTMGATIMYYVWVVSQQPYAVKVRGIDEKSAFLANLGGHLVLLVVLPIWGMISDRVGRKPVMLISLLGVTALYFPLDAMIGDSALRLFFAVSIAMVFIGGFTAIGPAVFAEIFPTRIRAVGLAVPYSIAVATFGGTAPFLQTFFAKNDMQSGFIVYAMVLAVLSSLVVLRLPETKGIDLAGESVGAHGRRKTRTAA